MKNLFDMDADTDIAWCPGCGNFGILNSLKQALDELAIPPENVVLVSGIGQAAKIPQYVKTNIFSGLHGRSLPVATAIKAANPSLTVIAESGDGCMYGEGGNHFIHAIRRNPGIVQIVHNNMVYGLTKGQASPTSERGFKTPVQVDGVYLEPFNPIAVSISLKASFVARAISGDVKETKDIIKLAIASKRYALIDIFQPCVSFNRINTLQWFRQHTFRLADDYDPYDRDAAFRLAMDTEKFALGVIYRNDENGAFEQNLVAYRKSDQPLYLRERDSAAIEKLLKTFV